MNINIEHLEAVGFNVEQLNNGSCLMNLKYYISYCFVL